MNREAIGAIGEVVGAGAVVITLLYLTTQIRQNTLSNRNAALQTISAQNAAWLSLIIQDEEVARIYREGQRNTERLSGNDAVRYGMLMTQFCRVFDAQYHQYLNGALPQDICDSSARSVTFVMIQNGSSTWWNRFGYQFSEPFQMFMNTILEAGAAPSSGD